MGRTRYDHATDQRLLNHHIFACAAVRPYLALSSDVAVTSGERACNFVTVSSPTFIRNREYEGFKERLPAAGFSGAAYTDYFENSLIFGVVAAPRS